MSLEGSKKFLKVLGIINIVFGIIGIIIGVLVIAGGGLLGIGVASGEAAATASELKGMQAIIGLAVFGGLFILVASVINVVEGCFDVKASKDISKIMPAWVFAVIGLVLCAFSVFKFVWKQDFSDVSSILSIALDILISVLTFVAANTVKKAAGK